MESDKVLNHALAVAFTGYTIFLPFHFYFSHKMEEIARKYPPAITRTQFTHDVEDPIWTYSIEDRRDFDYYKRLNQIAAGAGALTGLPAIGIAFYRTKRRKGIGFESDKTGD